MQNPTNHDQNIQKIWDLIKGARSALLVTIGPDGRLDSRPMGCIQASFEGTIWFLTFAHSLTAVEIAQHNNVLISYANPSNSEYVSLSGTARLVHDPKKVRELWSEAFRVWFPLGLDDPELALLVVTVEQAKYWTNAASAPTYAWAYLRARLFGTSPAPEQILDRGVVKITK